ncbi:hypothetical protein [Methylothermus subterraneus]
MSISSERHTVQNPLIRYAVEAGWEYLPPEERRPCVCAAARTSPSCTPCWSSKSSVSTPAW